MVYLIEGTFHSGGDNTMREQDFESLLETFTFIE